MGTTPTTVGKRVIIAEDTPIVSTGLRAVLEELGCEIVGVTPSGEEALDLAEYLRPDLLTLDMQLRGKMNGYDVLREVRRRKLTAAGSQGSQWEGDSEIPLKVVIITMFPDPQQLKEIMGSPLEVDGYLEKGSSSHKEMRYVFDTVLTTAEQYIPYHLLKKYDMYKSKPDPFSKLNPTEMRILKMLAEQGLAHGDIAKELGMQAGSVRMSVSEMYTKLGLKHRNLQELTTLYWTLKAQDTNGDLGKQDGANGG